MIAKIPINTLIYCYYCFFIIILIFFFFIDAGYFPGPGYSGRTTNACENSFSVSYFLPMATVLPKSQNCTFRKSEAMFEDFTGPQRSHLHFYTTILLLPRRRVDDITGYLLKFFKTM